MKYKTVLAPLCGLLSISAPAVAETSMEVIEITTKKITSKTSSQPLEQSVTSPDAADWLTSAAGAAANKNGAITGIAQYRGLFGDRVGVSIDGQTIVGAGPNAMDAPMSYVNPTNVESVTIYRGIAPVSAGLNTFGGAIKINHRQAKFSDSADALFSGDLTAGYKQQGDAYFVAPTLNIANENLAFLVFGNKQSADDQETASGFDIVPSSYERTQSGFDLGYLTEQTETHFNFKNTDTKPSGTAALPMDIDYIKTDQFNLSGEIQNNEQNIKWNVNYTDATHGMDNYSLRTNMNPMMTRYNTAESTSFGGHVSVEMPFSLIENSMVVLGTDWLFSEHKAVITSPDNMMFNVVNFNDVTDEVVSVFAEVKTDLTDGQFTLGLRAKQHESDAGDVSHHMAMMNPAIMMLRDNFNSANTDQTETLYDVSAAYTHLLSEELSLLVSGAIKQRAPSYQERYLWVPMQATGGLADGHTYVGNPELEHETAYQFNLGLEYKLADVLISPQLFYQNIDDYIQATPSTNMQANMVAIMMTGSAPMQFANVEASLYGADVIAQWAVNDDLYLDGSISMVRGERDDIDDDLYRISADTLRLSASYQLNDWLFKVTEQLTASQDRVSAINNESKTSGYGTTDVSAFYAQQNWSVTIGISNLFDKSYTNHLAGRYRPMTMNNMDMGSSMDMGSTMDMGSSMEMDNNMSSLQTGDKIPAIGRNIYISGSIAF